MTGPPLSHGAMPSTHHANGGTVLSIAAILVLLMAQGFLLQTSVALSGEAAPSYGSALLTALLGGLVGGLAGLGYSCTAGVFVTLFVSSQLSWAFAALVGWVATSAVYRRRLSLRPGHAMLVALLHNVMASALSGAVYFAVGFVS